MSEESISLYDLLNVSIGTPQVGAVDFSALHTLLHAVLEQLDIQQVKTRWRSAAPGAAPAAAPAAEEDLQAGPWRDIKQGKDGDQEVRAGTEQQQQQEEEEEEEGREASSSPASSSSRAADPRTSLRSRVHSCEEDVSTALTRLQQLQDQSDSLRREIQHQQETAEAQAEVVSAAEKCCLRVDTLEDTVRSLSGAFQRFRWVTWEDVQSALLSDSLQEERLNSEADDPAKRKPFSRNVTDGKTTAPRSSSPAAAPSAETRGQTLALQEATAAAGALDLSAERSAPLQQAEADLEPGGLDLLGITSRSECYPEAVGALRDLGQLGGKFSRLHARVVELEEGKLDQSELMANKEFQDASNRLMNQLTQQKMLIEKLSSDQEKNASLVTDVQTAVLQLQAECEKLGDCNRSLLEENREKESRVQVQRQRRLHPPMLLLFGLRNKTKRNGQGEKPEVQLRHTFLLQDLLKNLEELEEKKADKRMVERELKAEKSALESKVSHLQFDSEQLSAMLTELLDKVSGQEQSWHRVMDRLSSEMDCKPSRIELDSVRKQLENRWKNINEKLQAQEGPEGDHAAALRKQLVDRFNCLSCDRPIVKYTHTQHLMKLPSAPGFPAHKSIRPFTVYALEQFRQHYRSERLSGLADYSHMTVSRNCGGSHTVNSASQRRQSNKHHTHAEVDLMVQSEEVDIVGLDGHIYKGRLSAPPVRNTETTLPTISAKEGFCKLKDKVTSRKPATSPETAQGVSASQPHGAQCSRSASSSSGRDWPVSPLGCTSHTSFSETQTQADEPPGL